MNISDSPKKQPVPFGVNGQREDLLSTTPAGDNQASYDAGFPPVTMILKSAGGLPPKGQDMNQILYELAAVSRWASAGANYLFDSTFATAIGGYPSGAKVLASDHAGFWLNGTDANSVNPEASDATLTGWVPVDHVGSTSITGLAATSVTLSSLQAAKDTITLTGALTANINLILPAWVKRWEIINNCTGSFSVTVKTPSGTGVAIPSGSNMNVFGDGTNIKASYAPGSLVNIQVFPASATWTKTPGALKGRMKVWGAGGGGANTGATAPASAASGSGGGYAEGYFDISSITSAAVIVGAGGSAVAANTTANGGNGGASSVGALISATGGVGGGATPSGGIGTNGNVINFTGQLGQGAVSSSLGGTGGSSYGTYGGLGHSASAGDDGGFPGGGGAGGSKPSSAYASGKGAAGYVIIEEYA